MADTEPFQDAAFVSRLQKLLAMLASEQPGEADAARRKLMEHLASHRLSFTDIAIRLRDGGGRAAPAASFTQGAREMSLERQLSIARGAKMEAEGDAQRAAYRIAELQQVLQDTAFEVGKVLRARTRVRIMAALGWAVAICATCVAALPHLQGLMRLPINGRPRVESLSSVLSPTNADPASNELRLTGGERMGTVLVQDLAVRLTPSDAAGVRAFLNRGMQVVIEQQVRVGPQNWLLIRSMTGSGWVRGGDILH